MSVVGRGVAYRYDAVGSFERVGAVVAGKGEHLIQPFLDKLPTRLRLVSSASSGGATSSSLPAADQDLWEVGPSESFEPRHPPVIALDAEEAINTLVSAFRAAAEREITIGDGMHVWILKQKDSEIEKRFYSLPKS